MRFEPRFLRNLLYKKCERTERWRFTVTGRRFRFDFDSIKKTYRTYLENAEVPDLIEYADVITKESAELIVRKRDKLCFIGN